MSQKQHGVKHAVRAFRGRVDRLSKSVIVLAVFGVALSITATVYAISTIIPDPSAASQGPAAQLAIGRVADTNTLTSQSTSVKLVYNSTPVSVDVYDGAWCAGSAYDRRTISAMNPCTTPDPFSDVIYTFTAIDNTSGAALTPPGSELVVKGSTMATAGANNWYTVNLAGLPNKTASTDGKFFIRVDVRWEHMNPASCVPASPIDATCRTGTNFFRFRLTGDPNDRITYAVTNGPSDPLTVQSPLPGNATGWSTMNFEFAPPCGASDAQRLQRLNWEDADFGQGNQPINPAGPYGGEIAWELWDETDGTLELFQSGNALGGQGSVKTFPQPPAAPFQFLDGHKYIWRWLNVASTNGVQLKMPFDSYNYIRQCAAVDLEKTDNARPNQAVGEPFTFFVRVQHSGPNMANLRIDDVLPAGLVYVADASIVNPPNFIAADQRTLRWDFNPAMLNTLNTTGVVQLAVRVQATAAGNYTNVASGSGVDVNGSPVVVNPDPEDVTIITIDLTNKPFFSVRRGDISAGSGMDLGANKCTQVGLGVAPHPEASIVSWNRGAANGFIGAGGQQGAFALNFIQGFVPGQGSAFAPGGVSFANNGSVPANFNPGAAAEGGIYGGKFGNLPCAPDLLAGAPGGLGGDRTLSTILGIAPGGTYTVGTGAVPASRTVYLTGGDLIVDVNVRLTAAGNYANAAAIPSFSALVRGNIYVTPGVTRLDGIYAAQPSNATATDGILYTCAPDGFTTTAIALLNRNLSTRCGGQQLTINGAIVARQVWLTRTFGSLQANTPAEILNYAPEVWLNAPFTTGLGPATTGSYDAITSLPPTL